MGRETQTRIKLRLFPINSLGFSKFLQNGRNSNYLLETHFPELHPIAFMLADAIKIWKEEVWDSIEKTIWNFQNSENVTFRGPAYLFFRKFVLDLLYQIQKNWCSLNCVSNLPRSARWTQEQPEKSMGGRMKMEQ